MIKSLLKVPYHKLRTGLREWRNTRFVQNHVRLRSDGGEFDFALFKAQVLQFISKLRIDNEGIRYRYSEEVTEASLYSSAYACMTLSLLDELGSDQGRLTSWKQYFDSFQQEADGLFYDEVVRNEHFDNSDWWGARHLALHMISAYTDLGAKPRFPFRFLQEYYDENHLKHWLDSHAWAFEGEMNNDFDNKLMNIGCLLQYQRDTWNDLRAGKAVRFIQDYLLKKINLKTGIWGDDNIENDDVRSRKVQFAYHLFPIFFYDGVYAFDEEKVIDVVLKTQNRFGGYGVAPNSSACEDIDSIDILFRLADSARLKKEKIDNSLLKGLRWVLLNQTDDGGFVFRLNERFVYGDQQMSSSRNRGAIFPTWFRTLTIAYLCRYFSIPNGFRITRCPGYEF